MKTVCLENSNILLLLLSAERELEPLGLFVQTAHNEHCRLSINEVRYFMHWFASFGGRPR